MEAGLSVVEMAVVSGPGLVGHFEYYYLLFILPEMVCTAF